MTDSHSNFKLPLRTFTVFFPQQSVHLAKRQNYRKEIRKTTCIFPKQRGLYLLKDLKVLLLLRLRNPEVFY